MRWRPGDGIPRLAWRWFEEAESSLGKEGGFLESLTTPRTPRFCIESASVPVLSSDFDLDKLKPSRI
jgi:hypothetical protein